MPPVRLQFPPQLIVASCRMGGSPLFRFLASDFSLSCMFTSSTAAPLSMQQLYTIIYHNSPNSLVSSSH